MCLLPLQKGHLDLFLFVLPDFLFQGFNLRNLGKANRKEENYFRSLEEFYGPVFFAQCPFPSWIISALAKNNEVLLFTLFWYFLPLFGKK